MVDVFGLGLGSCLVRFLCSNQYISSIDYSMCRKVFESLHVHYLHGLCIGFSLLVLLYSYYYRTLRMQHYSNSWHLRNLLVMVLMLNKLAESMGSLHTTLLRRGTNFNPCLQCLLHSSRAVDNVREDPILLPPIFITKEVHLRQLATQTYQITPS